MKRVDPATNLEIEEQDPVQVKINRIFSIISGVLATYLFFNFGMITYFALKKFLNFGSVFVNSIDSITYQQIFVIIVIFSNIGLMMWVVIIHIVVPERVWDIIRSTL